MGWLMEVDDDGWRPTPQMSRRRLLVALLPVVSFFPRRAIIHIPVVAVVISVVTIVVISVATVAVYVRW